MKERTLGTCFQQFAHRGLFLATVGSLSCATPAREFGPAETVDASSHVGEDASVRKEGASAGQGGRMQSIDASSSGMASDGAASPNPSEADLAGSGASDAGARFGSGGGGGGGLGGLGGGLGGEVSSVSGAGGNGRGGYASSHPGDGGGGTSRDGAAKGGASAPPIDGGDPQSEVCAACTAPAPSQASCASGRCTVELAQLGDGSTFQIAVDSQSVYWTNLAGGEVSKVALGGGVPTTLATTSGVNSYGIALDAQNVYWTSDDGNLVMRVPIGGGTVATLASNQATPQGIAVDANNVYWANAGTGTNAGSVIQRSTAGAITELATQQNRPFAVAVSATHVFWTNAGTTQGVGVGDGSVEMVPIGGGTRVTLASGLNAPQGIALAGRYVVWASKSDDRVLKVNLDDLAVSTLVDRAANPFAVAADAYNVYFTSLGSYDTVVTRVPLEGGSPTTLVSNQFRPYGIAVDAASIYWAGAFGGIMKMSPK